jgi:hypothetical protein
MKGKEENQCEEIVYEVITPISCPQQLSTKTVVQQIKFYII